MAFLYDDYTTASKFGAISKTLPKFIVDNLRSKFVLRPYQIEAFARFVYFYERDEREDKQGRPYHLLYNMATGSGKTNVMAGLMLYLYVQGYRDFLFFVNNNTIIEKTKDNFLNPASSKYVFNNIITFDAQEVVVKEVQSFDESDPDNINIKFTTIQQLHLDMENPKENTISLEDFKNRRIVLLADEADNFNVATRGQLTTEGNWEQTIQAIHTQNIDNILLEFTATMDLETPEIEAKYKDKAIFKYELKEFRHDRYSKEIELLRVSSGAKGRVLHALILNLYRQVLAAHHHINLKPVILFKAKKTIAESERNKAMFHQWIEELTIADIDALRNAGDVDKVIKQAFAYFDSCGIVSAEIVKRTQENFKPENCISANNDTEKGKNQMLLNSLEDENNPIRAVFAVNKLDRGWDVLNLFDIVRMYDDRNEESRGKIGKTTRAEAQLIGRGARYFPFQVTPDQDLFMRKYDSDQANPLRILETLYYHIIGDSRYVAEIKKALVEVGMSDESSVTKELKLKEEFKQTDFFRNARVVYNKKVPKSYSGVKSLSDLSVKKTNMVYSLSELHSQSVSAFDEAEIKSVVTESRDIALANISYHIIRYALTTIPFYRFDNLTKYCPNLKSMRNFIQDNEYLGEYEITFKGSKERIENITQADYLHAVQQLLSTIENEIKSHIVEFEGSPFFSEYLHRIFTDKQITFPKDPEREAGQIALLADKEWYAFNANYGTSEERAFIEMFARRYPILSKQYDDIYVIRNERVVKVVDELGRVFEPDFLLYLRRRDDRHFLYQVFIEPKGKHLIGKDKWKEDYLKKLKDESNVFNIDSDNYHIIGVPFYNKGDENEFKHTLENLLLAETHPKAKAVLLATTSETQLETAMAADAEEALYVRIKRDCFAGQLRDDELVLVGFIQDKNVRALKALHKYYVRTGESRGALKLVDGYENCRCLLLHARNQYTLYRLKNAVPREVTGKELNEIGFNPSHINGRYLLFDLDSDARIMLSEHDLTQVNIRADKNNAQRSFYRTVAELFGQKVGD